MSKAAIGDVEAANLLSNMASQHEQRYLEWQESGEKYWPVMNREKARFEILQDAAKAMLAKAHEVQPC